MAKNKSRSIARIRRHRRVRKHVSGTPERPRLNVFRSLNEMYAQVIDDVAGRTLVSASTVDGELRSEVGGLTKTEQAKMVGLKVAERAKEKGIADTDIVATVTAFTAKSIARAYHEFLPVIPDEVILCGGGSRNNTLVEMLQRELPDAKMRSTDDFGINVDAKEAVSFAILAWATIKGLSNNVPGVTGADRPVIMGKIIPA